MGVDTKTKVMNVVEIDSMIIEISRALTERFSDKFIKSSYSVSSHHDRVISDKNGNYTFKMIRFALDYRCDQFDDNKEHRQLAFYYDHGKASLFYSLSTGMWGHSEEISKCLVDYFGGYSDFNDCDDISMDYCKSEVDSIMYENK